MQGLGNKEADVLEPKDKEEDMGETKIGKIGFPPFVKLMRIIKDTIVQARTEGIIPLQTKLRHSNTKVNVNVFTHDVRDCVLSLLTEPRNNCFQHHVLLEMIQIVIHGYTNRQTKLWDEYGCVVNGCSNYGYNLTYDIRDVIKLLKLKTSDKIKANQRTRIGYH